MSHLRTILPYYRPYRRAMTLGVALAVVSNGFSVAGPWLLRLAIDSLETPDITRGRIGFFAGMIVLAAVLGGAARYGMRELLNGISRRIECDLRADFFRHLLDLDASFYGRERTGDIMSRATNDTFAVRQAVGPAVMYSANTVVMSAFTLVLMIWISPALTALVMIPMLLLPPVVFLFGRAIHRRFQVIQEQLAALTTQVQENVTGVRLVRAYVQEDDQARRFDAMNAEYMARNIDLVRVQGMFHPTLGLITAGATVMILWMGGRFVIDGSMSVGDLVAFVFYLSLLTWPMIALGWVVNLFQRGDASMARINAVLQRDPVVVSGLGRDADRISGRIEFREVSFRYPDTEREVLERITFTVEPGETVAIVGPTGSGKSTLVSLIPRLYDPTDGSILLDGVPLPEYDPRRIRAAMGIVPQDTFLFSETIASNVGLGLAEVGVKEAGVGEPSMNEIDTQDLVREFETSDGNELDPRVLRASEIAQLHEQVSEFPSGYETRLGERGINLSGGQKQRAALARALARDPKILILDDALSAVDTHTESRILAELGHALHARTSLIISHRVSAVMDADRILVLDDGRIVERGTHHELIARDGVYSALLRRQLIEQSVAGATDEEDVEGGLRFARTENPE